MIDKGSKSLACVIAILLAGTAVSTLQERPLEPAVALEKFVGAERRAQELPGLAAVVVQSDGTAKVYVSGERRTGKGDLITTGDRMHVGSLTKSITATLVGALSEKGLMTLDTTISQAFPELSPKMQPAYRQVTVRQLLRHSAGIATYGTNDSGTARQEPGPKPAGWCGRMECDVARRRRVARALRQPLRIASRYSAVTPATE